MVTTDASLTGWGVVFKGRPACGVWTGEFLSWHIHWLELRAVFLALIHFLPFLKGCHVIVKSQCLVRDNTEGICGLESIRPDTSCPAEFNTTFSSWGNTKPKSSETDGWSTPQHEQLPSHTINTTLPHALFCPTKLYGSLSLRARSSILTS